MSLTGLAHMWSGTCYQTKADIYGVVLQLSDNFCNLLSLYVISTL